MYNHRNIRIIENLNKECDELLKTPVIHSNLECSNCCIKITTIICFIGLIIVSIPKNNIFDLSNITALV